MPMSDLLGVAGKRLLHECNLAQVYPVRLELLRDIPPWWPGAWPWTQCQAVQPEWCPLRGAQG